MADILDIFRKRCSAAGQLGEDLSQKTGTRLIDWIDHLAIPAEEVFFARLSGSGFVAKRCPARVSWSHPGGIFPEIQLHDGPTWRAAIKVESVADFLRIHRLEDRTSITGHPLGQLRKAKIASEGDAELWVVQRHGYRDWNAPKIASDRLEAVRLHKESFRQRKRDFPRQRAGFDHTIALIRAAVDDLGAGRACDLFFAAERDYWTRRNRAARVQKARQDAMGLGWANHDHHTYRSSRAHFPALVAALEALGMVCRERFYAGREAGWGAQVLEQPAAGITVFADVDLDPGEVAGDFAHRKLPETNSLGTVGLWCRLHGDALLQAGMHHLECRFDFSAAVEQLQSAGVRTMPPFVNLRYLKQAFTEGEIWPVDSGRIDAALRDRAITGNEAEQFRARGAIGSHLEILQRDEGYKGFDKSGINDIIRDTDPRRSRSQGQPFNNQGN